jgi:hypothetical protein
MNRLIALIVFAALAVSSVAIAVEDTSRLGLGIGPAGVTPPSQAPDTPADVLIASSTNGGLFTNLAPLYSAALTAAGAGTVTTIEDPTNGPFSFPAIFTSAEYGTLCVLTNDNWFGTNGSGEPEANVSLQDETRISAYMDTGGHMLFSGQDYLWGRGNGNGFPQIYLGIQSYTDDVYSNGTLINYNGVAGSPLQGYSGTLVAAVGGTPCFTANAFYADDIVPFAVGLMTYAQGQGGSTWDTGAYKTVFSSVELACTTNTQQFHRDVRAIYEYLQGGVTSVEPATWGAVKDMFAR